MYTIHVYPYTHKYIHKLTHTHTHTHIQTQITYQRQQRASCGQVSQERHFSSIREGLCASELSHARQVRATHSGTRHANMRMVAQHTHIGRQSLHTLKEATAASLAFGYTCTNARTQRSVNTCMYTGMCVCMFVCMRVSTHVCVYVCIDV